MNYSFESFVSGRFDWDPQENRHTCLWLREVNMDIGGGKIGIPDIDVLSEYPDVDTVTISGLSQETFEYFIQKYGSQLKAIRFFKNKRVRDWSMLGTLPQLEYIHFFANQHIDSFWDMSRNYSLTGLSVNDFTRLKNVEMVNTAPALEDFYIGDAVWSTTVIDSFLPLSGTKIKHLSFSGKDIVNKDLSFLDTMEHLESFDFPTNLYTTEQIAWIAANHPEVSGFAIKPYTGYPDAEKHHDGGWVVGKRKPYLVYNGNEAKIRKYEMKFEQLKQKYKGVSYKEAFGQ